MNFLKNWDIALGSVFAILIGILAIFIFASIGAVMGAISGAIVSIIPFLNVFVLKGFEQIFDITNPDLIAIGAMLGFIAGFFRSATSK
ncbi:hypothetical protein KO317_02325 [Candidatus Micrarchaeota archaeon]|nr:hypothetical protein [Candidatus Micrarchaeota archaeon]